MKTPLPPVLRAALYRRAVACAWLTVCERQHRYPHLTLESLEAAIAAELEGFYLRQHGEEKGRQIACAYFHERRSLNNFHRDRVITFEQIAE